ncbi:MAG: hypothetical protein PUK40_01165 [Actinomycetaceae bacterium]|nr:hypothetical protein [Actinomycetaceae bacterium]MDY6143194.1 hypothetical protein [Arcanobacterium sp.]
MTIKIDDSTLSIADVQEALNATAETQSLVIRVQDQALFDAMHSL